MSLITLWVVSRYIIHRIDTFTCTGLISFERENEKKLFVYLFSSTSLIIEYCCLVLTVPMWLRSYNNKNSLQLIITWLNCKNTVNVRTLISLIICVWLINDACIMWLDKTSLLTWVIDDLFNLWFFWDLWQHLPED